MTALDRDRTVNSAHPLGIIARQRDPKLEQVRQNALLTHIQSTLEIVVRARIVNGQEHRFTDSIRP